MASDPQILPVEYDPWSSRKEVSHRAFDLLTQGKPKLIYPSTQLPNVIPVNHDPWSQDNEPNPSN